MANITPTSARLDGVFSRDDLDAAIAGADVRVLLMVLFQLTGDAKWLSYRPKRDVKLIADEDAGLSPAAQCEIRDAARRLLSEQPRLEPVINDPGDELMIRMMSVCLGEEVPAEYAPLMREELGFISRDVEWRKNSRNGGDFSGRHRGRWRQRDCTRSASRAPRLAIYHCRAA